MTKPVQTMAVQWATFEANALPPETPADYREALRCAFYWGADAVLDVVDGITEDVASGRDHAVGIDRWTAILEEVDLFKDSYVQ